MINLKKIKKINNTFVCNVYIEDCKIPVPVVYDIEKRKLLPYGDLPEGYDLPSHMAQAQNYFTDVVDGKKELKEEKLIMWY